MHTFTHRIHDTESVSSTFHFIDGIFSEITKESDYFKFGSTTDDRTKGMFRAKSSEY